MIDRVLWFGFVTITLRINAEFLDSYWTKITAVSSVALEQSFNINPVDTFSCLLKCYETVGCQAVVFETGTDTCYGYSEAPNITTTLTGSGSLYCRNERCDGFGYTCLMSLNLCYKLHTKKSTWLDAKESCESEGATLFIVETLQQLQLLTDIGNGLGVGVIFWVGANDIETEGSWIWLNGKPLSSLFWRPGDPNNHYMEEDCIGFMETGLVDVHCTTLLYFLCQK